MQIDATRMYRVKDVAGLVDVDVSTIHRAIHSGELGAYRVGRGALRIPGHVLSAYLDRCAQAATRTESPADDDEDRLTPAQADGLACVVCGVDYLEHNTPRRPVGWSQSGSQVFACCEHRAVRHAVAGGYVDVRPGPTGREVAAARRARADAAPELDAADLNYGDDDLGAVTDLDGVSR
jgi:excisionase family DNA binding protein